MKSKFSKTEVESKINDFFKKIKWKSAEDVRKIKRLAMNKSIKLGEKRKLFCKKCLTPYDKPKIRIKKGFKVITCPNCGYSARIKIKSG